MKSLSRILSVAFGVLAALLLVALIYTLVDSGSDLDAGKLAIGIAVTAAISGYFGNRS